MTPIGETEARSVNDSRQAGARLRLVIMALLAAVVVLGPLRNGEAEGTESNIDLIELATDRANEVAATGDPDLDLTAALDLGTATDLELTTPAVAADAARDDDGAADLVVEGGVGNGTGITVVSGSEPVSVEDASPAADTADSDVVAETVCILPEDIEPSEDSEAEPAGTESAEGNDSVEPAEPEEIPAFYRDDFSSERDEWSALSGEWSSQDGAYVQSDSGGFDRITQLGLALPAEVRVGVDLIAVDGPLGGGMLISQPNPGSRNGAYIVDLASGGDFVRWGRYDADTGVYDYLGGSDLGGSFDTAASHRLSLELTSTDSKVFVDGNQIGAFGAVPPGRVGLLTSMSSVAFDNVVIEDLSGAGQ